MRKNQVFTRVLCLLYVAALFLTGVSPTRVASTAPETAGVEEPVPQAEPSPQQELPAVPAETAAPQAEPAPQQELPAIPAEEATPTPEPAPAPTPEPSPEPTPEPAVVTLSGGSFPADTQALKTVVTAEDLPLLGGFSQLRSADFRGSACQTELSAWALEHPEVSVRCELVLSDGKLVSADTKELSLPDSAPAEDLLALVLLPELKTVDLGMSLDASESPLDWEALARAQAACPKTQFLYSFRLYGKSFDLQSTEMDLNHIAMDDEGALVKKVAACLPDLTLLDMDFCNVSDEAMADIRDSLPNAEVVWRIWFGDNRVNGYTARTDVIKILASNPGIGGELTPENTQSLKYCTKVKYLDLGHNDQLTDISFVRCMPDLEVAILAMGGFKDLSPLADCPKLEYLEIQTGALSDLRPLAGLKNLRHLNVAWNFALTDITPLYELTGLERLWLGGFVPVPPEQVEEMRRRVPNCEINTDTKDPTEGGWRYTEYNELGYGVACARYELLREQFGYANAPYCYSYIPDDPLYKPHD